jgi:hypothetical protein
VSLRISRQGSLHDIYLLPRDQRVRRIHHDLITSLQPSDYFDFAPEVVTRSEIRKLDFAVPYNAYLQTLGPENEAAGGNQESRVRGRYV